MSEEQIKGDAETGEEASAIERLPEQLGLVETPDMKIIRDRAVEAAAAGDWPTTLRLRGQYLAHGGEIVEPLEGERAELASIGLTLAVGFIFRDGGRTENYEADLQNAHLLAWHKRRDDIAGIIEAELTRIGYQVDHQPERGPAKESPKRRLSDEYREELRQLAASWTGVELAGPADISLQANHLLVNGHTLEASDGPAVLWRALTGGREAIDTGLQAYREEMAATHPDKEISPDTPLRLVYLADYPRQVMTPEAMEKIDHFQREFHDINDIRPEFHEIWKAIDAAGRLAELRLLDSRTGWLPIHLWARKQET